MRQQNIRVDQSYLDKLATLFTSKARGVNHSCRAFLHLRKIALSGLKGHFSEGELRSLLEVFKIYTVDPHLQHESQLLIHILTMDHVFGEQNQELLHKIANLSLLETFFFQDELMRFWREPGYGYPDPQPSEFVEFMR